MPSSVCVGVALKHNKARQSPRQKDAQLKSAVAAESRFSRCLNSLCRRALSSRTADSCFPSARLLCTRSAVSEERRWKLPNARTCRGNLRVLIGLTQSGARFEAEPSRPQQGCVPGGVRQQRPRPRGVRRALCDCAKSRRRLWAPSSEHGNCRPPPTRLRRPLAASEAQPNRRHRHHTAF